MCPLNYALPTNIYSCHNSTVQVWLLYTCTSMDVCVKNCTICNTFTSSPVPCMYLLIVHNFPLLVSSHVVPAVTCSLHMASSLISKIAEDCDSLKPLPCNDPIQCRRYISKCMYISVCLHWTWTPSAVPTHACTHVVLFPSYFLAFHGHVVHVWALLDPSPRSGDP